MNTSWKKYLLYFAQEHVDFRFAVSPNRLNLEDNLLILFASSGNTIIVVHV